jgi:hypothetical protein
MGLRADDFLFLTTGAPAALLPRARPDAVSKTTEIFILRYEKTLLTQNCGTRT